MYTKGMYLLDFPHLKQRYPELEQQYFDDFCSRLDGRYFSAFDKATQIRHLLAVQKVGQKESVYIDVEHVSSQHVKCTVVSFDYPGVFSMLTGILCSMGLDIRSGEAFTFSEAPPPSRFKHRSYFNQKEILRLRRAKIIDVFEGVLHSDEAFDVWKNELLIRIQAIFDLLILQTSDAHMQAKEKINLWVSSWLWTLKKPKFALLPIQIFTDSSPVHYTRLKIITQDTPMFLYALSSALSLMQISIVHFVIKTEYHWVEDELDIVNKDGKPIDSEAELAQLKLSIGLIKQFAYFLNQASNPFDALSRFSQLITTLMEQPQKGEWIEFLSNPKALKDMATLFGASDFLWEDFIRIHYETLIPTFKVHLKDRHFFDNEGLDQRLQAIVSKSMSFDDLKKEINDFKNRELFSIDLQSILDKPSDELLSKHLSLLADKLIQTASYCIEKKLSERYGYPSVIDGVQAKWGIFGLGKLGGKDLGYASDLEILCVYSDSGKTNGPESINNEEYFERFVQELSTFIEAKHDGIFKIDLRLRPYGKDGPLAVSLDQFCQYFGPEGASFLYEKLALVRLRFLSGQSYFGAQIERLRDVFVYESHLKIDEFWTIRMKQIQEKVLPGKQNAKYSPGTLVDIEYAVQLIQVRFGGTYPELRSPQTRQALDHCRDLGLIPIETHEQLLLSYQFFRRLINGLRLLRGSSQDILLPEPDSDEFQHLARRVGYKPTDTLSTSQQLNLDFQTYSATVRNWIQDYFSQQWLPFQHGVNIADVLLNPSITQSVRQHVFKKLGFKFPDTAYLNTCMIARHGQQQPACIRLLVLACDWLGQCSDPDRALNNWERFISVLDDPLQHMDLLLKQPARLSILIDVFSTSQYLSDLLVKYPEYLNWVTSQQSLSVTLKRGHLLKDTEILRKTYTDTDEWRKQIRKLKHREMLRIAIRDLSLHIDLGIIVREISVLAEVLIQSCLKRMDLDPETEEKICILAMGKLGGTELNYSSDIDLVAICSDDASPHILQEAIQHLTTEMMMFTSEGRLWRVDWMLRPFGRSGNLVVKASEFVSYYFNHASLWEIQALLKAKPVAGNWSLGFETLQQLSPPALAQQFSASHIFRTIQNLREQSIKMRQNPQEIDVKNGRGGIRDIEFLLQGLQLVHGVTHPYILTASTLKGVQKLTENQLISDEDSMLLRNNYAFFRKVEHLLQIMDDRQTYSIPDKPEVLHRLALYFFKQSHPETFLKHLHQGFESVYAIFQHTVQTIFNEDSKKA